MKAKVEFTLPTGIRLPGNQHIPCKFDEKTRRSAAKVTISAANVTTSAVYVTVEVDVELDVALTPQGILVGFVQSAGATGEPKQ